MPPQPEPAASIVDLEPSDAEAIAAMPVRRFGQPWSVVVAEALAGGVARFLGGDFDGIGLEVDGELRAVAVWRVPNRYGNPPPRPAWELAYLATHVGHPRRGYARRLKIEVLRRARAAGKAEVISYVDWGNTAMLDLNDALQAPPRRIPGDDGFALCVCDVERTLAMVDAQSSVS